MFKIIPPDRGTDSWGSGAYHAYRDDGRLHNGIDKLAYVGSKVFSLTEGKVTKLGYAYADDLSYRYVEITDLNKNVLRYFYLKPNVKLGQSVTKDIILGEVQDLQSKYPRIGNHFHFEVKINKKYVDPNEYFKLIDKA